MALSEESNAGIPATMLVGPANISGNQPYPVYMGQGGNGGFGNGQDGWWIVLLIILLAAGNGFGNNGGGNNFGGMPYVINNDGGSIQRGFDQASIMSGINGIQSGINNLSTQLCNCCGDMQMAVANGFSSAEMSNNARQMANMQQMFSLQSQFADCCCENRLANCQTQNIIQRESSETRFADANNTRDIIQSQTNGTQAILDKLCQLELDGYKRDNDNLRSQLNMATLRESQTAQNSFIAQGFANEVDQLYNRLNSCPVPTTPVYGRTPIFTCNSNNSCGCGCGCGNF